MIALLLQGKNKPIYHPSGQQATLSRVISIFSSLAMFPFSPDLSLCFPLFILHFLSQHFMNCSHSFTFVSYYKLDTHLLFLLSLPFSSPRSIFSSPPSTFFLILTSCFVVITFLFLLFYISSVLSPLLVLLVHLPPVDTGDHVVVINTGHAVLTGSKWDKKLYRHHTGYPGGLKEIVAKQLHQKNPTMVCDYNYT